MTPMTLTGGKTLGYDPDLDRHHNGKSDPDPNRHQHCNKSITFVKPGIGAGRFTSPTTVMHGKL
jgi:hypothetical protein